MKDGIFVIIYNNVANKNKLLTVNILNANMWKYS